MSFYVKTNSIYRKKLKYGYLQFQVFNVLLPETWTFTVFYVISFIFSCFEKIQKNRKITHIILCSVCSFEACHSLFKEIMSTDLTVLVTVVSRDPDVFFLLTGSPGSCWPARICWTQWWKGRVIILFLTHIKRLLFTSGRAKVMTSGVLGKQSSAVNPSAFISLAVSYSLQQRTVFGLHVLFKHNNCIYGAGQHRPNEWL